MARRMIRRSSGRSRRRSLQWAREFVAQQQFTPTNSAVFDDLLSDFQTVLGADANGTTVTRIRGEVGLQWNLAAGASPAFRSIDLGIRVADVAPLVGTDAEQIQYLPTSRPYSDWMFARRFLVTGTAVDAPADARVNAIKYVDIDIKSQRRVDELQQSLFAFTGTGLAVPAGETASIAYDLHILLRKP